MSAGVGWQDAFVRALRGEPPGHPEIAALAGLPGFAVYRNTVWKGWVDAIEANFPAVGAFTGSRWLRAAAAAFATAHPPGTPALVAYGAGFPEFLAGLPAAADLPALVPLARLDRAWTEAHVAADDEVLAPETLALLPAGDLARLAARPHAALRAFWFDSAVPTLWLGNRPDFAGGGLTLHPRPEGLALVRPGPAVEAARLDAADFALLEACLAGRSLLAAAAACLEAAPAADPGAILYRLAALGAFAGLVEATETRS
ncbi:MAG: putative DNA-binding domain-containing protein [Rhodospirillales bacterium]|nr:putative DNA-binding domain-containing protein [Rhodospirillales bacterium]